MAPLYKMLRILVLYQRFHCGLPHPLHALHYWQYISGAVEEVWPVLTHRLVMERLKKPSLGTSVKRLSLRTSVSSAGYADKLPGGSEDRRLPDMMLRRRGRKNDTHCRLRRMDKLDQAL